MNPDPAIEIHGLECRYETQTWQCRSVSGAVVKDVSLQVPRGSVYALLGTNGAGKSTLIRALLNLIEPARGTIHILGKASTALEPEDWERIGFVSESQVLPDYLTLEELVAYCRPLYPSWDDTLCEKLRDQFGLPWRQKLKTFSRGMKLKAALVAALSYRPAVLILDEPFGGLDVLTRDELIQGMLELSGDEDWTIFLTSHDLDEIERLADWVGVMDHGVLHLSEPLETLRERFRRVDVIVPVETSLPAALPESCLLPEIGPRAVRWIDSRYAGEEAVSTHITSLFGEGAAFATTPLSLREILIAFTRSKRLNLLAS
jgi:ABC-2 type transport system ATP-binding protein